MKTALVILASMFFSMSTLSAKEFGEEKNKKKLMKTPSFLEDDISQIIKFYSSPSLITATSKKVKLKIQDEALVAAAELSSRYIKNRFLPDKAIDLVDEADGNRV
jgi:hypothetical protein